MQPDMQSCDAFNIRNSQDTKGCQSCLLGVHMCACCALFLQSAQLKVGVNFAGLKKASQYSCISQ